MINSLPMEETPRAPQSTIPAIGDKLLARIEDIAFGGEGVARLGDFVLFVPFTAVDERVEVEVTEVKRRFARGRLVRVVESSAERVEPLCRYFGQCGGCQYQHLAYPAQLRLKHKQICDLFQRIGGFEPAVIAPVIPCPQAYGYRNRIMIRSQWDKFKQGLNLGFIRADSRLVVDVEECKIAEPALNEQLQRVRQHPPPKGGLKVVLRVAPEGWTVPPDSFFQNNFFLLPRLVEEVGARLRQRGTRQLADIYCGVGFFSLELAGQVESFAGVELDELAIKAARRNASARGIVNGQFLAGTAQELLPKLLAGGAHQADRPADCSASTQGVRPFAPEATTVLLDPPRKGCPPEMLELLRQEGPSQIIYVSCHPATMARDLKVLCAGEGFKLAQVVPLDMFPQTQHVECVADLLFEHRRP